jgi:pyrroline-5-carboxylate reductase
MKIAMLGTGNMGSALMGGLIRKLGTSVQIIAYDKNSAALSAVPSTVTIVEPVQWFTQGSVPDAVIIAVKPYDIAAAVAPLLESKKPDCIKPLWISIAAGKTITFFEQLLPVGARICRVMPNTPALVDEGMSAYALSTNATLHDAEMTQTILSSCGKALAVPEKSMNAVTGLSGSGPAYVFSFIESLIEGGVIAGLPHSVAHELAIQTVIGAVKMAAVSNIGLADLKMKVMTPGGTTARGCMALEQHGFKYSIIKAVVAATLRSEEMEKLTS